MKKVIPFLIFLFLSLNLFAQSDQAEELVMQGIELHDAGNYAQAISKYEQAIKIDKKLGLAYYEMSLTYFILEDFKNALKNGKLAMKYDPSIEQTYVTVGNSLDILGKPREAIKAFEKGLQKFPQSNQINFNMAVTLFGMHQYKKAEKAIIEAILSNPDHASSHMVLSAIMDAQGQRFQAMLPLYYFLLIEPFSQRSPRQYLNLQALMQQGVSKTDTGGTNITLYSATDEDFAAIEMLISLSVAARYTQENQDKNEFELFADTNKAIFFMINTLKPDKSGFWWQSYMDMFAEMAQTDNTEAFSYFISVSAESEVVDKWLAENQQKLEKFANWFEN